MDVTYICEKKSSYRLVKIFLKCFLASNVAIQMQLQDYFF